KNNSTPYCTPLSSWDKTSVVIHCLYFLSVNFDPYSTFFYLHWIYSNILSQRFTQRFSGTHVEPPLVQRALDLVVFQKAVAQARVPVRTDVVGGVNLAFHAVKRQLPARRVHPDHVVFRHVVACQHINPVCHPLYSFFLLPDLKKCSSNGIYDRI